MFDFDRTATLCVKGVKLKKKKKKKNLFYLPLDHITELMTYGFNDLRRKKMQ